MYQIGEKIVYGIHGVCRVADLEDRVINQKKQTYLVLEPAGKDGSRYFVPTHNAVAMSKLRPILTQKQMQTLLASNEIRSFVWIQDENLRKQTYRELISSGNQEELMKMVYTLYLHKNKQVAEGKKVHQCDENFLRDAEKILCSEISIVLNIDYSEALSYLRKQLK